MPMSPKYENMKSEHTPHCNCHVNLLHPKYLTLDPEDQFPHHNLYDQYFSFKGRKHTWLMTLKLFSAPTSLFYGLGAPHPESS